MLPKLPDYVLNMSSFRINGIIQHVTFFVWLLSRSIMFSRYMDLRVGPLAFRLKFDAYFTTFYKILKTVPSLTINHNICVSILISVTTYEKLSKSF